MRVKVSSSSTRSPPDRLLSDLGYFVSLCEGSREATPYSYSLVTNVIKSMSEKFQWRRAQLWPSSLAVNFSKHQLKLPKMLNDFSRISYVLYESDRQSQQEHRHHWHLKKKKRDFVGVLSCRNHFIRLPLYSFHDTAMSFHSRVSLFWFTIHLFHHSYFYCFLPHSSFTTSH